MLRTAEILKMEVSLSCIVGRHFWAAGWVGKDGLFSARLHWIDRKQLHCLSDFSVNAKPLFIKVRCIYNKENASKC